MRRQIPRSPREANPNIAADLPNPDRLSLKKIRCGPEPKMQSLVNRPTNSLQGKVLAAAEKIERAHWRISILPAGQKCMKRFPARFERDRFGFVPSSAKCADQLRVVANDDQ